MATKAQVRANRLNATKHATGPRTPSGKLKTKLNGLKHGLRSREVVLPTEDPAAFQEHLDAWMADWKPTTMARAQLVEDAAVAAWRKKRCVRVESARLSGRVRAALARWSRDDQVAIDRALEGFLERPSQALGKLMATRAGIDRLLAEWAAIAEAASPEAWDDVDGHHFRLIALNGWCPADPQIIELRDASWRLYLRNAPEHMIDDDDPEPWDDGQAAYVCEQIRAMALRRIEGLRALRAERPDDAAHRARQAELEAFEPQPGDAPLLRYEGQLTRQFHKALADLVKLTESGADLLDEAVDEPTEAAPESAAPVASSTDPAAPSEANSSEVSEENGVNGGFSSNPASDGSARAVPGGPSTTPATPASDLVRGVRASEGAPEGADPAPNRV